jgi:2-phospho-L-lactate guanylyltransferase
VKALSEAKRRLATILPAEARCQLVLQMLDDLLGVLGRVEAVSRTLVVTPDPLIAERAVAQQAAVMLEERSRGLNTAVRDGIAHAVLRDAAQALVLPADLPFAAPDEVASLLRAVDLPREAAASRVMIAPSTDSIGTNALLLTPPQVIEPRFGTNSAMEHVSQAVAQRLYVRILHLPGLAVDIDEPRHVLQLFADARTAARYAFLEKYARNRDFSANAGEVEKK